MIDFADLIAPFTLDELANAEARSRIGLQHGVATGKATHLFDWAQFFHIAANRYDSAKLRVSMKRKPVPQQFYRTGATVDADKLENLVQRGISIVQPDAHRYHEALGSAVRDFVETTGSPLRIGAIGSTGEAGALALHSDKIDLLILQVEGAKKWRIYDPAFDPETDEAPPSPTFDKVLEAGEYLLVPKGHAHECDTAADRSLHLGIGFAKPQYDPWGG